MTNKKFYLTTPIFYPNAKLHLGHAYTTTVSDILVRYHRLIGDKTYFLTGSDENAQTMINAAHKAGQEPLVFLNDTVAKFAALFKELDISYDQFIRTTDQKVHWPGAQALWKKFVESGDIYKKEYEGFYCVGHEAFVTEKDLVSGKCPDHGTTPEFLKEENYFFRLSKYSDSIKNKIESDELKIVPESRKKEILSFLGEGLQDISFSRPRRGDWPEGLGVPVPGDDLQVMYVWCDALANYITALGYGRDDALYQEFWQDNETRMHVLGKDILRFHSAIWPGMLLSAGLPLPKTLLVHGFINVDGAKISKTVGNVIMPETIIETYGVDPVRYYFLREFPSQEDGDFSYAKFEERYNGDLANGIGNLVSRVSTLGERIGEAALNFKNDVSPDTVAACTETFGNYERHMQAFRLNEALADVWQLIGTADRFINEKKPLTEKDPAVFEKTIQEAAYFVSAIANFLSPFLPETAEKIRANIEFTNGRLAIKKSGSLFPRLG